MIFFKAKQSQEKKRRKYNRVPVIRKRALLQRIYHQHIAASHKLLKQEPLHYRNKAQVSNAT